ncbi:MAG: hypothetical protein WCR76_07720 [Sphaerochaetaceae bacterium]
MANSIFGEVPEAYRADAKKVALAKMLAIPRSSVYREALDSEILKRLTVYASTDPALDSPDQNELTLSYLRQRDAELSAERDKIQALIKQYEMESDVIQKQIEKSVSEYSPDAIRAMSRDYAAAFKRVFPVSEIQGMYNKIVTASESNIDAYLTDIMSQVEQLEGVAVPSEEVGLGWTESLVTTLGYVEYTETRDEGDE